MLYYNNIVRGTNNHSVDIFIKKLRIISERRLLRPSTEAEGTRRCLLLGQYVSSYKVYTHPNHRGDRNRVILQNI